MIYNWF